MSTALGLEQRGLALSRVRVLYQDPWLMAVQKPHGLLSQPGLGSDQQDSLISRLQQVDGQLRLVHRLDRDTSGILLLARGAECLRRCSTAFASRRVRKLYVADVQGRMERGSGSVISRLARLQRDPPRYGQHPKGRPSQTRWRLIEANDQVSRLWLWPLTGRSHQLRAHLSGIGHPILGDPIYGASQTAARMHLHGMALTFRHPFSGERLKLRCNVPFPGPRCVSVEAGLEGSAVQSPGL